ncbi:hypothetical protein GCM10018780_81860 [Streptomyces lanatus]|nr:hypothetical protein GCM10018780_81860 [Streptomyces lanatus]
MGVFQLFCAVMFVPVFVGLVIVGLVWDDPGEVNRPAPAVSEEPASVSPVQWTYQGAVCADGWVSASVGERGACSHHGGVAGSWVATDGTEVICRNSPPRAQEQIDRSVAAFGRIVC